MMKLTFAVNKLFFTSRYSRCELLQRCKIDSLLENICNAIQGLIITQLARHIIIIYLFLKLLFSYSKTDENRRHKNTK